MFFLRFKYLNRKRLFILIPINLLLIGGLVYLGVKKYSAYDSIETLPPIFAITWGSPTASMTHQISLVSFYSTTMPYWKIGQDIKLNDTRYYGGHTYQATSAHISSALDEPGVGSDWQNKWIQSTVGLFQNYDGSPRMMYPLQDTINQLKAKPVGKRVVLIQGLDGYHYMHPDDRCQNADGTLTGLSKSPIGTLDSQRLGNDGLPSGFACPYEDNFSRDARLFTQALVDRLVQSQVDVDYLLFDTENSISEWSINTAWEAAIMKDPRWPQHKAKLDELVRIRRGYPVGSTDPKAQFPVDMEKMTFGDWSGDITNSAWKDWDALGTGFPDRGNNSIFAVFKAQWPNIKSSSYGNTGWKMNDGNFDYNGHAYYGLGVGQTHASTINYGWLAQAKSLTAGNDGWHTLLFEQNQARGSVRAGFPIMPWIAFSGFRESSRWVTDSNSPYPRTPDPYWQENIRHMALLGSDPILNFAPNQSPRIERINLATNTLEIYGSDSNICGHLKDFEIDNSPENNGHYVLVSCTNGDSTNYRTRVVTSTPLKSGVAGGVVRMAGDSTSSNAIDQQTEDLLIELDGQIGTDGPRETVESERLNYTGNIFSTGLRHGNNVTYRVSYNRHDWSSPQNINVLNNGTVVGTLLIPAGKVGAYYNTSYNSSDKYIFEPQSSVSVSLITDNNLNSNTWLCADSPCGNKVQANTPDTLDPFGGNNAWKVAFSGYSILKPANPIPVKPNTNYLITVYLKSFSNITSPPNSASSGGYRGYYDSNNIIHRDGWFTVPVATSGWTKISHPITTSSTETTITPFIEPHQNYLYDFRLTEEPQSAPYIRNSNGLATLSIPSPNPIKSFTYKPKYIFSGTKSEDINTVLIDNTEAANSGGNWTIEKDLNIGLNTISIFGRDQQGNSSSVITRTINRRKVGDFNNDGAIDISDFTLLLYNWGITPVNTAGDFNDDGKIDELDFTGLLYWWNK